MGVCLYIVADNSGSTNRLAPCISASAIIGATKGLVLTRETSETLALVLFPVDKKQ